MSEPRFPHSLVIGKFWPPHAGHHHLIEVAASRSERVSVLVIGAGWEGLTVEERVSWLKIAHEHEPHIRFIGGRCDIPVDVDSETVWTAHVALMRAMLDGARVDAVFSGEPYGAELARRFEAEPVSVDPTRALHPISGRAIRADLATHWDSLHPAVRSGLVTRVVVVGAESTGTTTVSHALAERYRGRGGVYERTRWVAEYGREHTMLKQREAEGIAVARGMPAPPMSEIAWEAADFAAVASTQQRWEDEAAALGSPVLFCDTDAVATTVWERRYVGEHSHAAAPVADARRPGDALYLLTDHVGVPFEQDGWRDGEHVREEMTGWFVEELTRRGHSWVLLTGSLDERLGLAERVVDRALATAHARLRGFAPDAG